MVEEEKEIALKARRFRPAGAKDCPGSRLFGKNATGAVRAMKIKTGM